MLNVDAKKLFTIVPMAHGKIQIQIQTLTYGYQNWQDPDVFQNVISKII
jgi:hypothetical protein